MTTVSSEYFSFRLYTHRLAIPLHQVGMVIRAVELSSIPEMPPYFRGVFDYYGEVVPILDLGIRFGFPPRRITPDLVFILANTPLRKIALVADSADGVLSIPPDDLKSGESLDRGIRARELAITTGGIVLIYDIEQFFTREDLVKINEILINSASEGRLP